MFLKQAAKTDKNNNQGFTLVEILIAMAIFSIGILAVTAMQITAINSNASARKITDVTTLAEDRLERLMALPWNDPDLAPANNPHQVAADGYTAEWNITDTDLDGDGNNDSKIINLTVRHNGRGVRSVSMQYIIPQT